MYGMKWFKLALSAAVVMAVAALLYTYVMRPVPEGASADDAPGLKTRAARIEKAIEIAEHP